jgi:hypothetical protein
VSVSPPPVGNRAYRFFAVFFAVFFLAPAFAVFFAMSPPQE